MYNSEPQNISIAMTTGDPGAFRYAMVVEYDGSSYAGSQIQPNQQTIQSELESALSVLAKKEVKAVFSGRTDSGVHAKGQVVHFDLSEQIDAYRFLNSLNAILPPDISVSLIKNVDKTFHSQKSALYRWYRYIINNRPQRSAWFKEAVHIHSPLDIKEMNKALGYLEGRHDFSSFKSSNSANPARECIVNYAGCKSEEGIIYIDLIANRFLYNMVRIIVGTLIEIGRGIKPAEYMLNVLNAQDRTQAGPTARPEGLTLMSVSYDKKYELLNKEAIYNENILSKAS